MEYKVSLNPYDIDQRLMMFHKETLGFTTCDKITTIHYNNKGLFCDPNIIANTKERSFQKPTVANHNSSQTLKLLRYRNIHTHTIASPLQLPNTIQSPNFSNCNYFYTLFVINNASKTICNKPIIATT
jgi:hypothetical protein